ncbi:MAG: preprotein translocase subunit SecG, preprotein translocase subunit SecG [Patescibacteria group bacterium]|jgi:preprotein translocase subunit SecG|nr:preprotein translocase subunit SecG, preprotein translocase subunit SecG [Patescibacteria group bacterium]
MLALQIVHLIITVLLTASILLQQRGSGLGDAFGDTSTVYTSRRGAEKVLFYLTIVFGVSFIALAILQTYLSQQ